VRRIEIAHFSDRHFWHGGYDKATMGEDASRIRFNPGVFARLRSFAYNILKANPSGTLPQDRYRATLGGIKLLLKIVSRKER